MSIISFFIMIGAVGLVGLIVSVAYFHYHEVK